MNARWEDGWLKIPYSGPENAVIEIGLGRVYRAAYRDWDAAGTRVVQIQIPAGQVPAQVTIRVNGQPYGSYLVMRSAP